VTQDRIHHEFTAVAFAENFPLKEMFSNAGAESGQASTGRSRLEVRRRLGDGEVFCYAFGAVVFRDVAEAEREAEIARLNDRKRGAGSPLTTVAQETLNVVVRDGTRPGIEGGLLVVDELTEARSGIVALTVAQSVAMEYYERIVETMFERTTHRVEELERRGTVSFDVRPLHRFIGEAVGTRNEVLTVLHLLDKPDDTWDDPAMDAIYDDLRDEFDLADRHTALELKLRGIQESLELVLDVARDRRLVVLEATIVFLIVLELALSLLR
jgi:required for meiotic nuclear division protein 1